MTGFIFVDRSLSDMASEAAVFGTCVGGVVTGLAILLAAESIVHSRPLLIFGGIVVLFAVGVLTFTIDRL